MKWLIALALAVAAGSAAGAEVAGVKLEDKAALQAGGQELVLNGAGLRTRFLLKVYVAGLYLPEKKAAAADAIAAPGPKRVTMTMLRELKAEQLVNALNEGMEKNNPPAELAKLKPQVDELTRIMSGLGEAKKGDVIALDFLPESGTRVSVNGEAKGKPIAGGDFYQALLRVWLGENPVEESLKKAMLGQQ